MLINSIYPTFQGEVNVQGMGAPVIFLRLQGCHLRCYKRTLGVLCDTPEALMKPTNSTELKEVFDKVSKISEDTGIKFVTLTGGDPLWNDETLLKKLFLGLTDMGFEVSVETSGTISWLPYSKLDDRIYWVLDYKLKSSGVKKADILFKDLVHLRDLTPNDFIKLVVYDDADLEEAEKITRYLKDKTRAKIAIGAYWGGKKTTFEIFNYFRDKKLLGAIKINMQTHKMAVSSKFNVKIPKDV